MTMHKALFPEMYLMQSVAKFLLSLENVERLPKPYFPGKLKIGGGDQNYPKEKEMQEGKMKSEEFLQTAEKRREAKGRGERERYTQLTAEFQRIARRDEKAFLSDQCKERGKEQNGKDQRSLQEKQKYQENIPRKDGHNK